MWEQGRREDGKEVEIGACEGLQVFGLRVWSWVCGKREEGEIFVRGVVEGEEAGDAKV